MLRLSLAVIVLATSWAWFPTDVARADEPGAWSAPAACYHRAPLCRPRPKRFNLEVEVGPVWQARNDVAYPGNTGTRIALDEVLGSGPFPWGRVTFDWQVAPRHGVRLMLAPLDVSGTGTLEQPVSFGNQVFAAGVPTDASYRFNSYRLTYRFTLWCTPRWTVRIGATAKIRDAKIELQQGGLRETTTDVGFVPLLYVGAEYRLNRWLRLTADLDGAAAEQGRAFDFAVKLIVDLDPCFYVGFGYRGLEGGADNDTVYTFALLHQIVLSAGYRF